MISEDTLSIYSLALAPNIGPDAWDRDREQPVLLTLHLHLSLAHAASEDNVTLSVHYGLLSNQLLRLQSRVFPTLLHLADAAADLALDAVHDVHVLAEAPKLLLQAHSLAVDVVASPAGRRRTVHVNELSLSTLIGVNPPERRHKQRVLTTVSFLDPPPNFPHRVIVDRLAQHIESSQFLTLEAFATSVARVACFFDGMDQVTIKAHKPSAVSFAHSSGVQLSRNRAFFQRDDESPS